MCTKLLVLKEKVNTHNTDSLSHILLPSFDMTEHVFQIVEMCNKRVCQKLIPVDTLDKAVAFAPLPYTR